MFLPEKRLRAVETRGSRVLLAPRAAQVIELRYFGGLTEKETAEVLRISVATLKRDWEAGRAWLIDRLGWGQAS